MEARRLIAVLMVISTLLLSSCRLAPEDSSIPPPETAHESVGKKPICEKDSWTLMIYMSGADLENTFGFAGADIREILAAENQPDDVNILIQTGGTEKWSIPDIPDSVCRYHVGNGGLVMDEDLGFVSMGDYGTLRDFIVWGLAKYPAEKSALILWGHGMGVYGLCSDHIHDDILTCEEFGRALEKAISGETKLDFIGFDACLMQNQDFAGISSGYAAYMIGSEDISTGEGFPYDVLADGLYAGKDTLSVLKDIADAYTSSEWSVEDENDTRTMSVLDLSCFDGYRDSYNWLVSLLTEKDENPGSLFGKTKSLGRDRLCDKDEYNRLLKDSDFNESWFDSNEDGFIFRSRHLYRLYDVLDFLVNLNEATDKKMEMAVSETIRALDRLIVYNRTGSDDSLACGLSMFCPYGWEEDPGDY